MYLRVSDCVAEQALLQYVRLVTGIVTVPVTVADDCFCNSTLLYVRGTDKTKLLPPAVQATSAGRQQAAALREVLREEALAEVTSCVADKKSSSNERAEWIAVARSLIEGCFIEQDTATLLCGYLGVTIYVIAHADNDHLQITKYAGEALCHMQFKCTMAMPAAAFTSNCNNMLYSWWRCVSIASHQVRPCITCI